MQPAKFSTKESSLSVNQFILKMIRKEKFYAVPLFLILLYQAFFWTYNPYLLKEIIDSLAAFDGNRALIWEVIQTPFNLFIATWAIAMAGYRLKEALNRNILPRIRQRILTDMFNYSTLHTHTFYQNHFSGSVSNRILDMQNGVISILGHTLEFIFNVGLFLISITFLFFIHPSILFVLLAWLVSFVAIGLYFAPKILSKSHQLSQEKTTLVGHLVDALGNVSAIRLFSKHNYESNLFTEQVDKTIEKDRSMRKSILIMRILWEFTIIAALVAFMTILVQLYQQGIATVGDFAFVTNAFIGVIHNVWHLMDNYVEFSEELGKCRQALYIMQPHGMQDNKKAYDMAGTKGEIIFEDVHFSYADKAAIFKGKHIKIPAKQKVGLVGYSGSGKTSFVNLIMRLFDIDAGKITIDGHDISELKMDSLRNLISVIPQDTALFHRSLIDNIRYGNPEADDEAVIAASKQAHCHEFVTHMPEGYDTLVGEKGVKISGGQRQRVAIARAFLKQSPIIILDEATSALDSVTEAYIQDSLEQLIEDKTTLVIAHRLSTLSKMDRILVFSDGQIIEDGTHATLLKKQGQYAKMWSMQSDGFIYDPDEADDI